jgi:WD40 repeat protein/serine/threonine protein kinase
MSSDKCPTREELAAFALGELPEATLQGIAVHVEVCPACDHTLQELDQVSDAIIAGLRRGGSTPGPPQPLSGPRSSHEEDGPRRAENPADHPGAAILKLLEPSQRPGSLGRLRHYEILEVVGQGGFGTVLKAFDDHLHRVVAIKVLAPELATHGTARERFVREARATAAIRHENVIDIHAVDEEPIPHLVMEYIEGQTLHQKLDRNGPLQVKEILRIGIQIAEGLAAAHRQGLIHRDIKPSNILLENGVERVKISDFGLARAVDDASLTQSGVVAGTPLFMSPEQAEGRYLDHRSDLFSLGSVLYTLCTGHPPFRAGSSLAVLHRVCNDPPRSIRDSNSDIPEWLAVLIDRLLAKRAEDRFPSARELADTLAGHLARIHQPRAADPLHTPPAPLPASTDLHLAPPRKRLPSWKRHAVVGALIVAAGVAATYLVPGLSWPKGGREPSSTAASAIASIQPFKGHERAEIPAALAALVGDGDPAAAPPELVATLTDAGHSEQIEAVAISPDGSTLASSGEDHTVKLWDLARWEKGKPAPPVRTLRRHTERVISLAFTPDSQRLVSASTDGSVVLWDPTAGKELLALTGCSHAGANAAFSAGGQLLAATSRDRTTVRLWEVESGKRQEALALNGEAVRWLAFHPRDARLAFAGDSQEIGLWDIASDRVLTTFQVKGTPVRVAFSADGSKLAAITEVPDSALYCWDVASRQPTLAVHGHRGSVTGLAMDPRGAVIATADLQGTVRLWQPGASGEPAKLASIALPGLAGPLQVAFAPDGRYLAAAGPKGIIAILRLPDAPPVYKPRPQVADPGKAGSQPCPASALRPEAISRRLLESTFHGATSAPPGLVALLGDDRFLLPSGEGALMRIGCSPDGKYLAIPRGNDLIVFETPSGRYLRTLKGPGGHMRRAIFSPDSTLLAATAWDGEKKNLVSVWDIPSGWKALEHKPSATSEVDYLVFTSDSKQLVTSGGIGEHLYLADARSGEKVKELALWPGYKALIRLVGKHLVAADWWSRKVILWDTTTWGESKSFERSEVGPGEPALSPDGKWLAMGAHSKVKLCNLGTGEITHTLHTPGHQMAFTPDSKVLLCWSTLESDVAHHVTRWDVASGKELGHFSLTGPNDFFFPCLSHDGKSLYVTYPRSGYPYVRVFDADSGQERSSLGHRGPVRTVAIREDGKLLASGGEDGVVRIWDLASGALQRTLRGHQQAILSVAFNRDGTLLASGSADRTVRLWNVDDGTEVRTLTGRQGVIQAVAFSHDGKVLACAELDGAARLWDVGSGKLLRKFPTAGECACVAFSGDDQWLAAGDGGLLRLWDVHTGWCVATLPGHAGTAQSVAFHPDGQTLVSTGNRRDPTVRLWDLTTLQERHRLEGHVGDVVNAIWCQGGKRLISCGSQDATLRFWDLTVRPPQARVLPVLPAEMRLGQLAQTPDGRYLATGNSDGTLSILALAEPGQPRAR